MKNFIKNIILIIESVFYNLYMTCHPRFKSRKIKMRQVSIGDINPTMDSTYNWKNLQSGMKQLGVLKPIQVISREKHNEYGELTYVIGNGHHRYYLFTQFKSDQDLIKVYSRSRTQGERLAAHTTLVVEEAVHKVKSKQKIYNKRVNKNFSHNSPYTLFNSYGKK